MWLTPAAHAGVPRGWVEGLIGGGWQRDLRGSCQQPIKPGGPQVPSHGKRGDGRARPRAEGGLYQRGRGEGKGKRGWGGEAGVGEKPKMLQDTCERLNTVLQSAVKRGRIQ